MTRPGADLEAPRERAFAILAFALRRRRGYRDCLSPRLRFALQTRVEDDRRSVGNGSTDVDRGDCAPVEPLKISADSNIVLTSRPYMGYEVMRLAKTRVG
jgi:hypothetical protein